MVDFAEIRAAGRSQRDNPLNKFQAIQHSPGWRAGTSEAQGRTFAKGAMPPLVPFGAVEGALRNLAHHTTLGQIGIGGSKELERWQRRNPVSSFISGATGTMLPYALMLTPIGAGAGIGLRIATAAPGLSKVVKTASLLKGTRPYSAAALENMIPFMPLEATRTGLASLFADEGQAMHVAFGGAANLALIGGFSAAFARVASQAPLAGPMFGGELKILDRFPGEYDKFLPSQMKLRMLKDLKVRKSAEEIAPVLDTINEIIPKLQADILAAVSMKNRKALVTRLIGEDGKKKASVLNRFLDQRAPAGQPFEYTGKAAAGGVAVRRFIVKPRDPSAFRNNKQLAEARTRAGIADDDLDATMFLRHIKTTSKEGRDKLLGVKGEGGLVQKAGLQPVSAVPRFNDAWIHREREGLYVVMQRIMKRPRRKDFGDEYIFYKTDEPGRFLKIQEEFGNIFTSEAYKMAEVVQKVRPGDMTPHLRYLLDIRKAFPTGVSATGIPKSVRGEQLARLLAEKHPKLESVRGNLVAATRKLIRDARRWVTPGTNRYADDQQALRVWLISQAMFNRAGAVAQEEFFGKMLFSASGSLHKQQWSPVAHQPSIRDAIHQVYRHGQDSRHVKQLNEAVEFNLGPELTKGFEPEVQALLGKLNRLDTRKINEIQATQRYTEDVANFRPLPYHYMVSRTWRGRSRVPVYVEGEPHLIVGYGSGTRRQSIAEADAIIEEVSRASNGTVKLARSHDPNMIITSGLDQSVQFRAFKGSLYTGTGQDLALASKIIPDAHATKLFNEARRLMVRQPERFAGRSVGPLGAMRGFSTNLSEKEFSSAVYGNLVETNQYITSQLVLHNMSADFARLASEAPKLHDDLLNTIRTMAGAKEPWAMRIDQAIDKVMTPLIGVSATEMVRQTNRVMFDLTLAAGDIGFAALNAITPIQTVLPELALLLNAPPARLAKFYDWSLISGTTGAYNVSPLKIMRESWKLMAKPDAEFRGMFNRGIKENVIYKKFIEEFAGSSSQQASLRSLAKGETGVLEWMKGASEFLPAKTEEWSRGMAFSSGYLVGKNFFRLEGERLFQFAAQFTNRTMYLYTTADRPRIITGSVGSLFGLFKNWSFHNISNMARYTGEGFLHKNWSPLMWGFGGTMAVAGVGGIPLASAADMMSRFLTDKSLVQNTYDMFGYGDNPNRAVDAVFYGLPAFLGVSLQGRAAPPGANVTRDITMLSSIAVWDRGKHLGMALGEAIDHWRTTGSHPMASPKTRGLFMRAVAPRTMYRYFSFTEDRALKSLSSGNRLISDITFPESMAYTFGLTPIKIEKAFEVSNEMWQNQDRRREAVARAGTAYAEAVLTKNWSMKNKIIEEAILSGLPLDSVVRSGDIRLRNALQEQRQRQGADDYATQQFQRSILGRR